MNEGSTDETRKNIFFTVNCAQSVSYNIEVRALDPTATIPTPIGNNFPVTGFFSARSLELFYSYKTYDQNSTIFVNLEKQPKCSMDFYVAI